MKAPTQSDRPSAQDLSQCVHCGFCLQQCPTYLQLGMEADSPRGRIHLIRALAEQRVNATPKLVRHLDLCLQCRACETACPSSVPFGRIMEAGRAMLVHEGHVPFTWRLRVSLLRHTLPYPGRLRALFALLRVYQRSGLRQAAQLLLKFGPRSLREAESMLPEAVKPFDAGALAGAATKGRRVALLTGCVMPYIYPRTHEATARVLARNGCNVSMPGGQRCCGALSLHAGDRETARELARKNVDALLAADIEAIVVNSAGCGSTMKQYDELLANDPGYAAKAARFASLVKDVTEYLSELPFERPLGLVQATVTYQDSCHLVHAQRVKAAPREIMRSIAGIELVEMQSPDRCCGSAGIYSFSQREMSLRLLNEKVQDMRSTEAAIVATANPGCMMQLESGLRRAGVRARVMHVVELLDEAYRRGDDA